MATPDNSSGPSCNLLSISGAARKFGVSEQTFHRLRRHELFPQDCEVVIGPRCVRFRDDRLNAFAAALAAARKPATEPERLRKAREERKAQRDPSSQWIPNQAGAQQT